MMKRFTQDLQDDLEDEKEVFEDVKMAPSDRKSEPFFDPSRMRLKDIIKKKNANITQRMVEGVQQKQDNKLPLRSGNNSEKKFKHEAKSNRSLDEFTRIGVLGGGAFGEVNLVEEKSSQLLYALKEVEIITCSERLKNIYCHRLQRASKLNRRLRFIVV